MTIVSPPRRKDNTVKTPGFASSARTRTSRLSFLLPVALWCGTPSFAAEPRPLPQFERIVIDDNFPGAYQVEVADVNGDGKPDVVALGGGTCAWYENPTWKKRIVTNPKQTPGIISTATADLDGDGKAEIAIAYEFSMNQPTRGKLSLAHPGKGLDDPWTLVEVADVGSIHRLRWMKTEFHVGTSSVRIGRLAPGQKDREKNMRVIKSTELVVAPLFGPSAKPPVFAEESAHLVLFTVSLPKDRERTLGLSGGGIGGGFLPSKSAGPKTGLELPEIHPKGGSGAREIGLAPVLHAIDVVELTDWGLPVVLGASNLGVTMHYVAMIAGAPIYRTEPLAPGTTGNAPKRGASEIHVGRFKDGRKFLATVEPWHGTDVAVYISEPTEPAGLPKFGSRTVIDTTLNEGHALWVADVDGDGDDEVFAGNRGKGTSLLGYDFDGKTWTRTVIDTAIAAQDLRGGDIDGDGTPDFVGVGGSTHNVVWYRPKKD
jgi:hypothetical protein